MAVRTGLNTADIKSQANQELLALLQGVRGKKNIVLQKSLVGVINLLVRFSTLQSYGVERIFWLDDDNVDSSQRSVVFLASGEKPANAQLVARKLEPLNQSYSVLVHSFSEGRIALIAFCPYPATPASSLKVLSVSNSGRLAKVQGTLIK